jgi:hypothetical protein
MAGIKVGAKSQGVRQPREERPMKCLQVRPPVDSEVCQIFGFFPDQELIRFTTQLVKACRRRVMKTMPVGKTPIQLARLFAAVQQLQEQADAYDGEAWEPAERSGRKRGVA